jgi:hypothetical protein
MSARKRFLKEYPAALLDDVGAAFIGAGVSVGAGYPSWRELLREIGEELGVDSGDVQDLAALAQWSVGKAAGRGRVNQVLREQIAPVRPIPTALATMARLPVRELWTTNYDRLIERAFEAIGRPIDAVSAEADLGVRRRPGATRLYKMHGTIDRLDDIVLSTDDYEMYRRKRGGFLPLLQAHLTSSSMLFLGLSFTDPNLRHVLSVIRDRFRDSPPEHFAIVRPPQEGEFPTKIAFESRATQHRLWAEDLKRYGLLVVEIEAYGEVDELLRDVERRVAARHIWVSGSWPPEAEHKGIRRASAIAEAIGEELGKGGYMLVTGGGLTVGSASITGFLGALQRGGDWDLQRRLVSRPFPQPVGDTVPNQEQWTALRTEMARLSGAIVMIGGARVLDGELVSAAGAEEEYALAKASGALVVPVGSTGGTAGMIGDRALSGELADARLPSKADLKALADPDLDPQRVALLVREVLRKNLS